MQRNYAMGGTPSRVGRKVTRTWNVENRARKVIEKREKDPELHIQSVAPKHESTKKLLDDFRQGRCAFIYLFKQNSLKRLTIGT